MNKFTLVFLTFLIIISNTEGQWEILNEGIGGHICAIEFVNEKVGWMMGSGGVLLKTEDGGETWNSLPSDGEWIFTNIDFLNDTLGWATGYNPQGGHLNIIQKTLDGGHSWIVITNEADFYPRAVHVVDDTITFVIGGARILKTSDGGLSWNDLSPYGSGVIYHSIWFFDGVSGIVTGVYEVNESRKGLVLKTLDGGRNWKQLISSEYHTIHDLQFINDSTFYFLAYNFDDTPLLCKSKDTCRTWSSMLETGTQILSYHHINENLYVLAEDSTSYNALWRGNVKVESWEKIQILNFYNRLDLIYFFTPNIGYITGETPSMGRFRGGSVLFKTLNQGNTWNIYLLEYPFLNVAFIDNRVGFACGGASGLHGGMGDIFATKDGGISWDLIYSAYTTIIKCTFVNENVGFAIFSGRFDHGILKTTDAGNNWMAVFKNKVDSIGYDFNVTDICFKNEQIGWAVGSYGDTLSSGAAFFGTKNSGENWDLVWKLPSTDKYSYELNSIHIVGANVWSVGESGLIVKYTEQDQWRVMPSITGLPLNDVFFSDENYGWISGGYYDEDNEYLILLQTTNGGETWWELPDIDYQINDIFFEDSLRGWAVGNHTKYSGDCHELGIILETIDGGSKWNIQVDGLIASLHAIYFKDDYIWTVGDNGLVLRTDNRTTWIDHNTGEIYPSKFKLSQNYPNPFNPSTTIEFNLPKTSKVTLKIYNILGEEVATLVSDRLTAGSYTYEWEAFNLSSGVYLFRLSVGSLSGEAGDFSETRKMVLMK